MISDFASRFDSFYSARLNQQSYLETKGYRSKGDCTVWEPTYEVDIEPEADEVLSVGAMEFRKFDDFDCSLDCEEYYQFQEF